MLTAKNVIFTPAYAAHVLGRSWHVFFEHLVKVFVLTCAVAGVALVAAQSVDLRSWPRLAASGLAIGGLYSAVVWGTFLTRDERREFRSRVLDPVLARLSAAIR